MNRITGTYRISRWDGEEVRAFVPSPLPPAAPPLDVDPRMGEALTRAMAALGKLNTAAGMVSNIDWFLYGFVRKEALLTSQVEGTEATFQDVLAFEAGEKALRPDDVQEVCNYVDALKYARRELSRANGLPLATRLLCECHKRLMKGVRGKNKQSGEIRRSQNWIGGSRPGTARFVPPPPGDLGDALSALEKWIHSSDPLPPLIRIGLAHVQFETIHPFLDGNGRIGRLLIALLLEEWRLVESPLLYISVAVKRHQSEYYARLDAVRTKGDWEGWTYFFLECVIEASNDAVDTARELSELTRNDRDRVTSHVDSTVPAIRLIELLPSNPIVTLASIARLTGVTPPTATRIVEFMQDLGILRETTGRQRDRVYAYHHYLELLTPDTD